MTVVRSTTSLRVLAALLWLADGTGLADEPGWLYYGGDQGGRHYSSAAQINTDNVADLEVAWVSRSGDMDSYGQEMAKTSTQSTPILLPKAAGESLVYCTPFNRVIAVDPGTGEQRWEFDPGIDRRGDRPFRCRGVTYAEESRVSAIEQCRHRLYMGTHDRKLWAIDATNGKPCDDFGDVGKLLLHGDEGYVPGDVSNSSAPVGTRCSSVVEATTSMPSRCPTNEISL